MRLLWAALALWTTQTIDLPTGQIIPRVSCASESSQSYALYLPRGYAPSREWPVIFAFDPGGRGRTPVERYQAAAEQYGFIVAGSNNSRNGSTEIGKAVAAMTGDVASRVRIDPKRIYLAGMSGGSRVALAVALGSPAGIAGVIASSAGYPDSTPRKTVPFPIFSTAGTEDFNHLEMRRLDAALTSPHHLAIFEGGHTWLSSELAIEAVEWMELQAMKSGLAPRNDREIEQIFSKRMAPVRLEAADKNTRLALESIVADFQGLRDVSALAARVAVLGRDKSIRAALSKDHDEDDREDSVLREIATAQSRLAFDDQRFAALSELRQDLQRLSETARRAQDSADRRIARRVLGSLSASPPPSDPDYLKILNEFRRRTF